MATYQFVRDFSGTVNGVTERHAVGDLVEIESGDDVLVANGDVVLAGADVPEDTAPDEVPEALRPPQRLGRVSKKTAAQ